MEITKVQLKKLNNIKGKAEAFQKELDRLVEETEKLLNAEGDNLVFDFVMNDFPATAEDLLKRLEITVK
jgi:hypothetical protein